MLVILTGRSGAGRTTALRTLEDMGFFSVDNLLPQLWEQFIEISPHQNIALSIDVRAEQFLEQVKDIVSKLEKNQRVELIYLDATDEVLIQRYNLTRRVHPLPLGSLLQSLKQEHELLLELRSMAHWYLDTSDFAVRKLVQEIQHHFEKIEGFQLRLISFGFKHGAPIDADNTFDLRSMPNPYYDQNLRPMDGRNKAVQEYVFGIGEVSQVDGEDFYQNLKDFSVKLVENAFKAGRMNYTLAIGCTGGMHRSVATVERLTADIALSLENVAEQYNIQKYHRDVDKGHKEEKSSEKSAPIRITPNSEKPSQ